MYYIYFIKRTYTIHYKIFLRSKLYIMLNIILNIIIIYKFNYRLNCITIGKVKFLRMYLFIRIVN